jgi:pathogenesis-related protein 1
MAHYTALSLIAAIVVFLLVLPAAFAGPAFARTSPSDIDQYLDAHNSIRSQKGAVALVWDDTLASYAQQVANTCVFQHSGGPYGGRYLL